MSDHATGPMDGATNHISRAAQQAPNLARAAAACLTVAILWFASDLLIPMAFAGLLSFIVIPMVSRLTRIGVPNAVATTFVMVGMMTIVGGIVLLTSSQALDLVQKLPEYRDTLVDRIRNVRSSSTVSFSELQKTYATIDNELNKAANAAEATTAPATTQSSEAAAPPTQPVAVRVVDRPDDFVTRLTAYAAPVVGPLGGLGVVFLISYFAVLGRESLARKAFKLCVRLDLVEAVDAAEEAGKRVSRYLRAQLLVNIIYGASLASIMFALGLPNALMWGLLGGMLRYIPYLGPMIAITMPTLLSLAVAPGWTTPTITLVSLLALELFTNIVLETLFFGNSTGVSPLGVVISFLFWGWVWGASGLLLGMPITVCIVVIGRHVRPLRLLSELLAAEEESSDGSKEPLSALASQSNMPDVLAHQRIPDAGAV
jgi:predicted PurR-regulated permease PerM